MSDLNQLIKHVKKGGDIARTRELASQIIKRYELSCSDIRARIPICCHYIGKLADVLENSQYYIESDSFRNYASSSDEVVIGCSRGCLPLKELTTKRYIEELCEGCVREAKEILKMNEKEERK